MYEFVDELVALYLTGEELSINAHQPTQPKKRPGQNQYQNPANLLPPAFGSQHSTSPSVGFLPGWAYISPHHNRLLGESSLLVRLSLLGQSGLLGNTNLLNEQLYTYIKSQNSTIVGNVRNFSLHILPLTL